MAVGDDTLLRHEATPTPPVIIRSAPDEPKRQSLTAIGGLVTGGLVLIALIALVVVMVRTRSVDQAATAGTSTSTAATVVTTVPSTITPTTPTTVTITIPVTTAPPPTPAPTRAPEPVTMSTPAPRATSNVSNVGYYPNVDPVNLRVSPSLSARVITRIPEGTSLPAICKIRGETLPAGQGGPHSDNFANDIWIRTTYQGNEGFVVDAVMRTLEAAKDGTIPSC